MSPQEKQIDPSIFNWNGLPFKGPANIDIKNSDPSTHPVLDYEAHAKVFHTNNEEEMKEYLKAWDNIVKGKSIFGIEERQFNKEQNTWMIFLRWCDKFYIAPKKLNTSFIVERTLNGR